MKPRLSRCKARLQKLLMTCYIIIIIKLLLNHLTHRTRKKYTLCKPERPQNHDTYQASYWKAKRDWNNENKIELGPQDPQVCKALIKDLKVLSLNTPDGSKFHRCPTSGRNDRVKWKMIYVILQLNQVKIEWSLICHRNLAPRNIIGLQLN